MCDNKRNDILSKNLPNPSRLNSYLPVASPYTTPSLTADTPTKLLVPTKAKTIKDFTLDVPNSRWFFDSPGTTGKWFIVHLTTSFTTSALNHTITIEMYKNGVLDEGVSISRFVSTGTDRTAIALNGISQLSDTDYIEIYATTTKDSTITFERLAITINEIVGAV